MGGELKPEHCWQAVKEQYFGELERLKKLMDEKEAAGENAWESRVSARPSDTQLLTSSALPQVPFTLPSERMIAASMMHHHRVQPAVILHLQHLHGFKRHHEPAAQRLLQGPCINQS